VDGSCARLIRSAAWTALLLAALAACAPTSAPPPAPPTDEVEAAPPAFANRVWRITSPAGRAMGSFYLFLSDGTLVMTSCVETYRLAAWHLAAPDRVTIVEDATTSYSADVRRLDPQRLELRLHLKSEIVDLGLEPATTPFVCPDLRPSPR
jgi:hypothetical protein